MEPLATYKDATLSSKTSYELFPDRIVLNGNIPGSTTYERSFDLNALSPDYIKRHTRPSVAWLAIGTSILTGFAAAELAFYFRIESAAIPGVLFIYSAAAAIVAIATWKKVEYATFCSADYKTGLISISRSGPDRAGFDNFIASLAARIAETKDKNTAAVMIEKS